MQRLVQRRPLIAYEPRRSVPWNGVDLAAVLCILVLAFCTVGYILVYFYHGGQMPKTPGFAELMANLGAELIAVELAILLLMHRAGATATDFGLNTARLGYDLRLGALGYLLVIVPITLLQNALSRIEAYHHPLIDAFRQRHDMLMIAGTTVAAIVVAPLCEELVFRVMLQGWFESLESARQGSREKSIPSRWRRISAAGDVHSPDDATPAECRRLVADSAQFGTVCAHAPRSRTGSNPFVFLRARLRLSLPADAPALALAHRAHAAECRHDGRVVVANGRGGRQVAKGTGSERPLSSTIVVRREVPVLFSTLSPFISPVSLSRLNLRGSVSWPTVSASSAAA